MLVEPVSAPDAESRRVLGTASVFPFQGREDQYHQQEKIQRQTDPDVYTAKNRKRPSTLGPETVRMPKKPLPLEQVLDPLRSGTHRRKDRVLVLAKKRAEKKEVRVVLDRPS